jgi:transcriptional regulator with XRE-family HTH domain
MSELSENLAREFSDREYREAYADDFTDSFVAMQIRAIREQRGMMTQKELADRIGTAQAGVSRLENANYSGRSVSTLKKLARQFDCWLRVSFESYGLLVEEADRFGEEALRRPSFDEDPAFTHMTGPSGNHQSGIDMAKSSPNTGLSSLRTMAPPPGNKVVQSHRLDNSATRNRPLRSPLSSDAGNRAA